MVLGHNINHVERTQDIRITVDITFGSMLIKKKTLKGLESSGFYKPSPIQLHGIPLGKCGFDLFLEAKSGTGKTAVFTVIALEKVDLQKDLQCIILAPTREIAAQISDVIKEIGSEYDGLNVEVVMGGLPIEEDINKFQKKVHILVGSPGRMRHLIQDKHINVSSVRLLVLDEADKLMEKSFQSDINYIFSVTPKEKQIIMSSATYPEALKSVMQNYVHKVQHVAPENTAILLGIKQLFTTVPSHSNIVRQTQIKFKELSNILTQKEFKQCLIFCNYQIRVVELCKMLLKAKWPAEQLHGQLEQCDRLDALKTLQDYKCRILVSTDLAARGIDASNVDLVINFEPPYEWNTYLHRMGRAGRFGAHGIVITILSKGKEISKFKEMIKSINSSLTLSNVWDNSELNLGDSDIHLTSMELANNILEKEMCNMGELPGIVQPIQDNYGAEYEKDNSDVEDFSMLLGSFDKSTENKIETFNELISSLKGHERSDYVDNKIEDFTACESASNCKTHPKANVSEQTNGYTDMKIEISNKNNNIGVKNVKSGELSDMNITLTHSKKNVDKQITNSNINNNLKHINLVTLDNTNKSLIDAGLPTAFGSAKYNGNQLKSRQINENSMNRKQSDIKCRKFNKSKKTDEFRSSISRGCPHRESKIASDSLNDAEYNIQLGPGTSTRHNRQRINEEPKKFSETDYAKGKNNKDNHKKYLAWYNMVKTHIKAVEMSIYISELSKI